MKDLLNSTYYILYSNVFRTSGICPKYTRDCSPAHSLLHLSACRPRRGAAGRPRCADGSGGGGAFMPAPRVCEAHMSRPRLCELCAHPPTLSEAATAVAVNLFAVQARLWRCVLCATGWPSIRRPGGIGIRMESTDGLRMGPG